MSSSAIDVRPALAQRVEVTSDALVIDLTDGRSLTVPLAWYPRLAHGTVTERSKWRLIGRGEGIHWPDLDEDIGVEGLLARGRALGLGEQYLDQVQQILESHSGEARRLNYLTVAQELEKALASKGEPMAVVDHYNLLYRGESMQDAHAGLTSVGRYLDASSNPWTVRLRPDPDSPTLGRLGIAGLLMCQLIRHVFREFGVDAAEVEAIAVQIDSLAPSALSREG